MSILIKGMEMPKSCDKCIYAGWSNFFQIYVCEAIKKEEPVLFNGKQVKSTDIARSGRADNCPLIEVPPHGRLIDADELHRLFEEQWDYLQCLDWAENPKAETMQTGVNWCINTMHDDAPTIIPADKEGT